MNEELLLLTEVASLARVSVSTVRQWVKSGRLRSCRPGRRRMVQRAELQRFLSTDIYAERRQALAANK